jgi:hypothetical protein
MPDLVSCPNQCGAQFQNASRVMAHLNHPWSPCHNYFTRRLQHQNQNSPEQSDDLQAHERPSPEPDPSPDALGDVDMSDAAPSNPTYFPNAGRTYGRGLDFMSAFDNDIHADKRKQIPVYPWASKQEWEMMSWLSRCGLSMARIDEFFRLELVCIYSPFNGILELSNFLDKAAQSVC